MFNVQYKCYLKFWNFRFQQKDYKAFYCVINNNNNNNKKKMFEKFLFRSGRF